jgi:hypothetical protein
MRILIVRSDGAIACIVNDYAKLDFKWSRDFGMHDLATLEPVVWRSSGERASSTALSFTLVPYAEASTMLQVSVKEAQTGGCVQRPKPSREEIKEEVMRFLASAPLRWALHSTSVA